MAAASAEVAAAPASGSVSTATAAATHAVLRIRQSRHRSDRGAYQQGTNGSDYISRGHFGHRLAHSSSPRFTPSSFPGRWPAIH